MAGALAVEEVEVATQEAKRDGGMEREREREGESGKEGSRGSDGHPHHTTPHNLTGHSVRCQSSLGVGHSAHKFTPVQRGRLDTAAIAE